MTVRPALNVFLCAPRGFCAGVTRAIDVVEHALRKFGAPVYVRHEIVHNRYVVEELRRKGAVFVEELSEVPDGEHPVIFSAHGVPRAVPEEAEQRELLAIDATCPLVMKVHREAEIHYRRDRMIVLVGHKGHPEVIGTMGQLPDGAVVLVESAEDVAALTLSPKDALAYVTQTTLSLDDLAVVVDALVTKYPGHCRPAKTGHLLRHHQSSGSGEGNRARGGRLHRRGLAQFLQFAQRSRKWPNAMAAAHAQLVLRASDIDWTPLAGIKSLGVTAGASAPEILVEEILGAFSEKFELSLNTVTTATEDVSFPLPRALREKAVVDEQA